MVMVEKNEQKDRTMGFITIPLYNYGTKFNLYHQQINLFKFNPGSLSVAIPASLKSSQAPSPLW
jgi:hypothetical protein